jgi:hypothetical protein
MATDRVRRSTLSDAAELRDAIEENHAMAEDRKFNSYDEFFTFYLQQHSDPRNRRLHAIGTTLGIAVVVGAFVLGHPWYALLFFPIGYGFAWTGHFGLEKNKPATFGHPFWSFISDFRMLGLMFTGRLAARMKPQMPQS